MVEGTFYSKVLSNILEHLYMMDMSFELKCNNPHIVVTVDNGDLIIENSCDMETIIHYKDRYGGTHPRVIVFKDEDSADTDERQLKALKILIDLIWQ